MQKRQSEEIDMGWKRVVEREINKPHITIEIEDA